MSSGADSFLWVPEFPLRYAPPIQGFDVHWPETAVPAEPSLSHSTGMETPDVPATPELSRTVVTHTAVLLAAFIVALALPLVRRTLAMGAPRTLTGSVPRPEPPPPRLLAVLYTWQRL